VCLKTTPLAVTPHSTKPKSPHHSSRISSLLLVVLLIGVHLDSSNVFLELAEVDFVLKPVERREV